ncbi:MAG: phosphate acyltransferase PlsX [Bryobacterales bacterium]|nr:phosphate acyltransferase PlsX [Bryobacterales bacterium]
MLTIAVDAMGGDHAPKAEVEGALSAVRDYPVAVTLVGREEVVRAELTRRDRNWASLPISVVHASEFISMDDSAAKAVRTKKDSSIRVASRLVRDGLAAGVISAGNTGAVMATAKMVQGMVHGVDRPSLATTLPTKAGTPVVLLDVGANVDCSARMLAQFAIMGEVYYRAVHHNESPRIGILSIGEEESKGNELTKTATPLLKSLPINFVGNVEGRDIYTGSVDVIVCDGFVGNVVLKTSEGVADLIKSMLREEMTSSILAKAGAVLASGAFGQLKRRLDHTEYGGAPLLGVKGMCLITHGSSNGNAIKNSIRVAIEYANGEVNRKIEEELAGINQTVAN